MKTLSIIVPCFNEEEVITIAYNRLKKVLSGLNFSSRIIFINDGSRDKTREILSEIAAEDTAVTVIHFSRNFGHQKAVTAGIHHCQSDLAVIIDADLQDPPELIPELIAKQEEEQANVVYCVRKSRAGESKFKLWTAKTFYRSLNNLSEVKFPLDAGDFRLIDANVIREFKRFKENSKYIRGIISWIGFKQVPFYYEREARIAGETKYPFKKMLAFASTALFYFSKKPLIMAVILGFSAVFFGIILATWYMLGKVFGYINTESGWTSLMITIIFFGGIQLLTVGVLGQYIGILFDEVKERPEYIIDKIEN